MINPKETSPLLSLESKGSFDLWQEHARALRSWDDLLLARWLNQTLGQLVDRCWRASHPLVVAYRLGATVAHQRDLWNRKPIPMNSQFLSAACCGAPTIPFVSFEICTHGIYCSCCGDILATLEDVSKDLRNSIQHWGKVYETSHHVAHWNEEERRKHGDYDKMLDRACDEAVPLLARLGYELSPRLVGQWPVVIWEDADHCLDIIPEDIAPPAE